MDLLLENFHFLRPQWLWAILPVALLTALLWNSQGRGVSKGWTRYIDPHLLTHLAVTGGRQRQSRLIPVTAFAIAVVMVLGLAGPSWQKSDIPSFTGGEPVVAVLSLAQSMNADDLTPSRLKRSVHKLRDILSRTEGDERGLVIYSDVPFVAAPLTNDQRVIEQMLPELSTSLMPVLGNRLDLAINEAHQVLARADAHRGQIIVIADNAGSEAAASLEAANTARAAGYEVSVLGVGTEAGATLQTADGRAIATRDGQTFMTKLSKDALVALSDAGGGRFSMITPDDSDLNDLLPASNQSMYSAGKQEEFKADSWVDMGYWLLIIPALLVPLVFRRGMIMGLVLVTGGLLTHPHPAAAGTWNDLWSTRDQQAQKAFQSGDFATASKTFETPDWLAGAAYRAGEYSSAATAYSSVERPGSDYNLGNSLAWSGDLEAALAAYDRTLDAYPSDEDAQFNRDLIAKLLEQQQQENQDQQDQQDQQSDQDQNGESNEQQNSTGSSGEETDEAANGQPQESDNSGSGSASSDPATSDPAQSDEGSKDGEQPDQADGSENSSETADSKNTKPLDGQDAGETPQQAYSQDQQPGERSTQSGQPDQTADSPDQPNGMKPQASRDGQPQDDQAQKKPEQSQADQNSQSAQQTDERGENALSRLFSEALSGNGKEEEAKPSAMSPAAAPVNQAVEQQLRRVPDDPSGLLRARIHQHYARMSATQ